LEGYTGIVAVELRCLRGDFGPLSFYPKPKEGHPKAALSHTMNNKPNTQRYVPTHLVEERLGFEHNCRP